MATKLQESFVNRNLHPGKVVFEFGPGDCSWAISRKDLAVFGIDLYPRPDTVPDNMVYIEGDLLDTDISYCIPDQGFMNVVALSSFEHAGIEQPDFLSGRVNPDAHFRVAIKLIELTAPGGRILLTMPAGVNETYVVDKDGISSLWDGKTDFLWGYRTFTMNAVRSLFPGLGIIDKKAYIKTGKDYFVDESWTEIDPESIDNIYSEQNGLVCVAMEKV